MRSFIRNAITVLMTFATLALFGTAHATSAESGIIFKRLHESPIIFKRLMDTPNQIIFKRFKPDGVVATAKTHCAAHQKCMPSNDLPPSG